MTLTLADLRTRTAQLLMDTSGEIWPLDALDNSLRLALGELSRAYGQTLTLSGLDGALVTTLEVDDSYTLVIGAAAYAAAGRTVDRTEIRLAEDAATLARLDGWWRGLMERFDTRLEQARRRSAAHTANPPQAAWTWDADEERRFT